MIKISDKERYYPLDILRILATFAVVWLHTSANGFYASFPTKEWVARLFYDSQVRWSVPIFVMISGALFLDKKKELDLRRLFSHNIARIVYIYLFWSLIYATCNTIINGLGENGLLSFIKLVISGPIHFWFLRMLIGLYIIIPILRVIVSNEKTEVYFLILAAIITFSIPMLFPIIGHFNTLAKDFFQKFYSSFRIDITSGYVGYFVLGHYLKNHILNKNLKISIFVLGIISMIIVFILTYHFSIHSAKPDITYFGNVNLFTLFEAMAIYLLFIRINVPTRYNDYIKNVSKKCFGIYLIHMLILKMVMGIISFNFSTYNPFVFIPIFSIIVFVISYIIITILIKIPGFKKLVI